MGGLLLTLLMFVPVILLMWFTARSQQKKQKALEARLKKGDRVVTQFGVVGKIAELSDSRYVKLEIAPGVRIQMLKSAIAGIEDDAASSAKGKDDAAPANESK